MFLNQINPVKQDTVTFMNDVYSYDAVLENVDTNTFQILKQYELNVQVPDISLSGDESVAISGSLGSSIVSNGNIAVVGNQDVTLEGHSMSLDSLEDLDITSAADTSFYSDLATSIQSSGVSVTTTGAEGVNITSAGDVDFATKDETYVAANQLSNTNVGDVNLDAKRGFFEIASGTRATLSSEERTHINGVSGVTYASSGSITVTSEEAFFFGQAVSNLAMKNTLFTYATTIVAAEEDIKVFADSVSVTSLQSNIFLDAPGQYANILLTGDSGITLQALSLISFASQGEAGDVVIISNQFDLTSFTFNSVIGEDLILGGNNTDNVSLTSKSTFVLKGYYFDADVDDSIYINATSNAIFNAAGDLFFQTNSGTASGSNSLTFQSINSDFDLYTDVGDGSVLVHTFNSNIVVTADEDLVMDTFDFDSHFTGVQDFLVGDLSLYSADSDINLKSSSYIDIATNDVSFESYNIQWNATDRLDFNVANSVFFYSQEGTHLISNNSISFTSVNDSQSYSSGNDIHLQNVDTNLVSTNSISYDVNSFSLKSGNSLFYAGGSLNIQLFESFHAVVTDDFELDSNIFTINDTYTYFKSSNIDLVGSASATLSMDTFTGKFGYVLVDATGAAKLDTNDEGDINVVSGEDITLTSSGSLFLQVGDTTYANAEEDLTFSGKNVQAAVGDDFTSYSNSGDQTVETGDSLTMTINYDSAWNADVSISIHAGTSYTVNANGEIQINGGETSFISSAANNQLLSIFAEQDIEFTTPPGNFDFEIAETGRALNFDASNQYNAQSGDSISYSSGSLDFTAGQNIASSASKSFTYSGSTTIINGTTVGDFTASDLARFVSGDDDYVNVDSAQNLNFRTQSGDFNILGQGDVKFEAVNFITLLADEDLEFASEYIVNVHSDDSLTILATGDSANGEGYLDIISYYSVNFDNSNGFDTLIRSNNDAVSSFVFRDFGIEANGIDELLDCGILLSASTRSLSTHEYNTDGEFEILAEHCVDIRSYYTDQTISPSGNINIVSDGHVFLNSETEGVTLISNGVDPSTNFAIVLEAYAGVEIQATKAGILIYGETGIDSYSGNNFDVLGLRGVTLKSNGTNADIDFESGDDTFAAGARGLTLAAGTDAPFFAGDFTATAEARLVIESANNILFRSFSTVSGPDAIRFTTGSTVVESREGAGVFLSAAADVNLLATDDTSILAEDGLLKIDADVGDLTVANTGAITWTTTHGPIGVEGKGSGGSITFNNQAFTSRSYLSTRIDALGSGAVTTGTTLDLFSPDQNACVLVETFRAFDDVTLSAGKSFNLITDANAHVYDIDHVVVTGNNIDIAATDSVNFLQSELFEIGRDSTPIVRVIAGGAGATGVTVSSRGDIEVNTGSTYSSISTLDTTFNSLNINVTSQGVILLIAEGTVPLNTDFKITSLNYLTIEADYTEEIAPDLYLVNSADSINIQSRGDDPGDRVEFDSLTSINSLGTPLTSTYQYAFDVTLLEAGDISFTTTGAAGIFNSFRTFENSYDYYYYNLEALETEKGQIEYITGDSNDLTVTSTAGNVEFGSVLGDVNVDSGFDVTFTVATTTSISSFGAVDIKSGNNFQISTAALSFDATAVNQYYLYNELAPRDIHSGEVLWTANDQITLGPIAGATTNININAFGDIIVDSFGSTSLTVTDTWTLTVSDLTSTNAISFDSQNDIDIQIDAGNFVWSNTGTGYFYYDLLSKDFISGGDTDITAATITASSTEKDVNFEAQILTITDTRGTLTATSGDAIYIETLGAHSDIQFLMSGNIDFDYTLADFLATDLNLIKVANGLTINDQISEYHSYFGDVSILGTTVGYTSVFDIVVDAYGRNNAKLSAVEINANNLAVTADDIYWEGYQSADFRSYSKTANSRITFANFATFDVQSTNFGGDIVFYTFAGPITFNVATSYLSESDEALYTSAYLSTFQSDNNFAISTLQDYSRVLVETKAENSFTRFTQSATTTINTNRYSEYKTSDKSDFDGQINIIGTLSETFTSRRAATYPNYFSKPGIEVKADEYGIWMHNNFGGNSVANFNAINMFLDADRNVFTGTSGVVDNLGNGNTQIRAQEDIAINAVNFVLNQSGAGTSTTFETDGLDTDNNIVISNTDSTVNFNSAAIVSLYGRGSNTNIEFVNDISRASGSINYGSTNQNFVAEQGIRFLTNNNAAAPISFTSSGSMSLVAEDWEDSLLFQSDADVIITVSTNGQQINERTYNHRLGFFDQTPDFINFVNLQAYESCVNSGFCGWNGCNGVDLSAMKDAVNCDI